jgi:hypothetical protein
MAIGMLELCHDEYHESQTSILMLMTDRQYFTLSEKILLWPG